MILPKNPLFCQILSKVPLLHGSINTTFYHGMNGNPDMSVDIRTSIDNEGTRAISVSVRPCSDMMSHRAVVSHGTVYLVAYLCSHKYKPDKSGTVSEPCQTQSGTVTAPIPRLQDPVPWQPGVECSDGTYKAAVVHFSGG